MWAANKPSPPRPWTAGGGFGDGQLWWAPADAEALSRWVGRQSGARSFPDCFGEVRNGVFVLLYYIRVVYLVAWDSENLSREQLRSPVTKLPSTGHSSPGHFTPSQEGQLSLLRWPGEGAAAEEVRHVALTAQWKMMTHAGKNSAHVLVSGGWRGWSLLS